MSLDVVSLEDRHAEGRGHVETAAELGAGATRTRGRQGGPSPRRFGGSTALPTP